LPIAQVDMILKSACLCSVLAETFYSLANLVERTFILPPNLLFCQNIDNNQPFLLFAHFFQIKE
jgi:hypothetical protein